MSLNLQPLVSCMMPTANRRSYVPRAIAHFLSQDYPERELIIVDDGPDKIMDLMPDDNHIRYIGLDQRTPLGAKRNLACREARGDIIVHWDDDDWMASWRLSYQVEGLLSAEADICGLDRLLFYEPSTDKAWEYVYPKSTTPWVAGGTLCYTKEFWSRNPFPNVNVGEDTRFVWTKRTRKIVALEDNTFYVAMVHPGNTSPKRIHETRYVSRPPEQIRSLLGDDLVRYRPSK